MDSRKDTNRKIRTTFSTKQCDTILVPIPNQVHKVHLLRFSHTSNRVCANGTKFGTNQISTDVHTGKKV